MSSGSAPVVITSLMQCAARSAPQLRSAPRSRASISFVPTPSVEAASRRRSSSGYRPAHAPRWGISPQGDQGIAGGIMMIEGSVVTLCALAWLFLRLAQEGELRQQLLEQGVDPRAAARAVRYGRGHELSHLPDAP